MNQPTKDKTNYFQNSLPPVGAALLVGVLLSWVSQSESPSEFSWDETLRWLGSMLWGVAAHQSVLVLWLATNRVPRKKTILGFMPFFVAGAIFTYLGFLFHYWAEITKAGTAFELFISVLMISTVIQALIYPSKTYDQLINLQARRLAKKIKTQALVIPTEEGDLILEPAKVSCVWVEDHYLHIIHKNEEGWAEKVIHGKLKEIEEKFQPYLVKVSRSALVNPKHSLGFSKTHLNQSGMEEGIKIPLSRMAEVAELINLRQPEIKP